MMMVMGELYTLPETNSLHLKMDGWKMIVSYVYLSLSLSIYIHIIIYIYILYIFTCIHLYSKCFKNKPLRSRGLLVFTRNHQARRLAGADMLAAVTGQVPRKTTTIREALSSLPETTGMSMGVSNYNHS